MHGERDIELWGGVECTVNRVGDTFFDQLERTGHAARLDDLDRIAAIGVTTVRYPVLWERAARSLGAELDFTWTDARLARLRDLGLRVIVGLVHHGSGPRGTSLLEPSFADGLADFAGAVAARYPWVEDFTPVNEPLTTARFSGLYGHWYPHAADARSFARALFNQCDATARAMDAVRRVNPRARLVQTEDIGKVFASRSLQYQADFENQRRWLSLDLLRGRVTREHALFGFLRDAGLSEGELLRLADAPSPPDLIGVNYYVTSDRFLDEGHQNYPPAARGGNGRHVYVDVEAVRARQEGLVGHRDVLLEVYRRYGSPVALTEVHLGCFPEEQIRWLNEAWAGAAAARAEGADVRAVTMWSLFGAYDWDSLVTRRRGHYEPGVYDVRGPTPAPTALAVVARELSRSRRSTHPLVDEPGWWRRHDRLLAHVDPPSERARNSTRRVLVVGALNGLAGALIQGCRVRGLGVIGRDDVVAPTAGRTDLRGPGDEAVAMETLEELGAWLVLDARGRDDVEASPSACGAPLAAACRRAGVRFAAFSSARVFGEAARGRLESHPPAPSTRAGRCEVAYERLVADACPEALLLRVGPLFGDAALDPGVGAALQRLRRGDPVALAAGRSITPSCADEVARWAVDLAIGDTRGVVHLVNAGGPVDATTWLDELAQAVGVGAPAGAIARARAGAANLELEAQGCLSSERVPALSDRAEALRRLTADLGRRRDGAAA